MKVYRKLFKYVSTEKNNGILAVLFSFISVIATCIGYYYIYNILKLLILSKDFVMAKEYAFISMICLTLGGILYIFSGLFSHKLGFRVETNLKKRGIDGITNASFKFFDINESGVIRKTIDDNASMTHQAIAHMIPDLGQAFLTPILVLILAFLVSFRVGILLIATILVASIFIIRMMGGETSFMQVYQDALKRLSGETVEYVRGIQVVKIFKADINSFKALYDAIYDYSKNAYAYSKSCKFPYVTYQWIFLGVISIIVLPISFYLSKISDKQYFMIEIIMYFFLIGIIYVTIMRIMYASQNIFNASYAVDNLEKIYEEMLKDKLEFGSNTKFKNYNISFENVSFSYGEKYILENFNLDLQQGKSYALVGESGSGKSTIAKLLSGFYKVDNGKIKIGDKSISSYTEDAITDSISFVFQDPKLFKISIYDNVAIAKKNAKKGDVMKALKLAGCNDILEKLPQREKTLIGEKGVHLSGGEKQRIAIARAILKDAPILIMDEASAAIDADNEYKLQESFKELMRKKTVVMIAHRLSSIKNVDEIIVLKNGKVVEKANHKELIKYNSEYKRILDLYNKTNDWRVKDEGIL